MIISMRLHAPPEEIEQVCERIREFGYKVHSIQGEERVVIAAVGVGDVTPCLEALEAMPGVEKAVRISAPYKFVSREFRPAKSRLRVNGHEIGGDEFIVMAGPCSVESEKQIMTTARSSRALRPTTSRAWNSRVCGCSTGRERPPGWPSSPRS